MKPAVRYTINQSGWKPIPLEYSLWFVLLLTWPINEVAQTSLVQSVRMLDALDRQPGL